MPWPQLVLAALPLPAQPRGSQRKQLVRGSQPLGSAMPLRCIRCTGRCATCTCPSGVLKSQSQCRLQRPQLHQRGGGQTLWPHLPLMLGPWHLHHQAAAATSCLGTVWGQDPAGAVASATGHAAAQAAVAPHSKRSSRRASRRGACRSHNSAPRLSSDSGGSLPCTLEYAELSCCSSGPPHTPLHGLGLEMKPAEAQASA